MAMQYIVLYLNSYLLTYITYPYQYADTLLFLKFYFIFHFHLICMKILNIAEKPSVARSISHILSNKVTKCRSFYKYTPVHSFYHNNNHFLFTSVLGHLYDQEFTDARKWHEFDPKCLFETKIKHFIKKDFCNLQKNLVEHSKKADKIIIWTDCDREGEYIAHEIEQTINRPCHRARFSAITRNNIQYAIDHLTIIDHKQVQSVATRMELDLRIGAAYTRYHTMHLGQVLLPFDAENNHLESNNYLFMNNSHGNNNSNRNISLKTNPGGKNNNPSVNKCSNNNLHRNNSHGHNSNNNNNSRQLISYGSCQIPTLGFIVARSLLIANFVPEPFYSLAVRVFRTGIINKFDWQRGKIFDRGCVQLFMEMLVGQYYQLANIYNRSDDSNGINSNNLKVNSSRNPNGISSNNLNVNTLRNPNGINSNNINENGSRNPNGISSNNLNVNSSRNPNGISSNNLNVNSSKNSNEIGSNVVISPSQNMFGSRNISSERDVHHVIAEIVSVDRKTTTRLRPLPLRTVDLQRLLSKYLPSDTIMVIAEKLYSKGIISYPRTETNSFDKGFDWKRIKDKLMGKADENNEELFREETGVDDTSYNHTINNVNTANCVWKGPRKGLHSDMAHEPIYPLRNVHLTDSSDQLVYGFIRDRFLACCNEDAKVEEWKVGMAIMHRGISSENHKVISSDDHKVISSKKHNGISSDDHKAISSKAHRVISSEDYNRISYKENQNENISNKANYTAGLSSDISIEEISSEINSKSSSELFFCTGKRLIHSGYLSFYKWEKVIEKRISQFTVGEIIKLQVGEEENNDIAMTNSSDITTSNIEDISSVDDDIICVDRTNNENYKNKRNKKNDKQNENDKTNRLFITSGITSPPMPLKETDLIALMDKHGIGTDATIHEHIKKILHRKYVYKRNGYFLPTQLGSNLIMFYKRIGLSLDQPKYRAMLEQKLKQIENGEKNSLTVLKEEIEMYKEFYQVIERNSSGNYNGDNHYNGSGDYNGSSNYNSSNRNNTLNSSNKNDTLNSSNRNNTINSSNRNNALYSSNRENTLNSSNRNNTLHSLNRNNSLHNLSRENTLHSLNRNDTLNSLNRNNTLNSLNRNTTLHNSNRENKNNYSNANKENSNNFDKKYGSKVNGENTPNILNSSTALFTSTAKVSYEDDDEDVRCDCRETAILRTVQKGRNKNKQFFSCQSFPNGCNYFKWQGITNVEQHGPEQVKCECGNVTRKMVANTDNNRARAFYKCNRRYKPCKFFLWADE